MSTTTTETPTDTQSKFRASIAFVRSAPRRARRKVSHGTGYAMEHASSWGTKLVAIAVAVFGFAWMFAMFYMAFQFLAFAFVTNPYLLYVLIGGLILQLGFGISLTKLVRTTGAELRAA